MSVIIEQLTDVTLWEGYIYVKPNSPFIAAIKRTNGKLTKAKIYSSPSGISKIFLVMEDGKPEVHMTLPTLYLNQCITKLDSKAAKVLFAR